MSGRTPATIDRSLEKGIEKLGEAFVALANGDFGVRVARSGQGDPLDVLAYMFNSTAAEVSDAIGQLEEQRTALEAIIESMLGGVFLLDSTSTIRQQLEEGVTRLSEAFLALAAGDFSARAPRSERGDALDVLAYLFNNTAAEIGDAVGQLEEQRSVLEAILESMLDGVLLLDRTGTIRRANGAFARMIGIEAKALLGSPLASLLHPTEADLAAELPNVVSRESIRDRGTSFVTAGGELLELAINASAQRDVEGAVKGVVLVVRDDRELKQAQAQLQLADRMATMGTLAAGVAHEINNPLAFVIGNLEFIEEELTESSDLPAEVKSELIGALKSSLEGAERVRKIVRELKTFSRVDGETRTSVDLNAIVASSLNMIHNELRHHARVTTSFGDLPRVEADGGRLGQVVLNLLQNAAHAIPVGNVEDNEIRVVTGSSSPDAVFLEVRDTGSGIDEKNLKRIFDAFFTTKPVGFGTGLGLSISHKIISSLGGRIEVESKVGEGALFRVVLPASTEGPTERMKARARSRAREVPKAGVLVIDDEKEIGDMVRRILGRDHAVDFVTRAAEALFRLDDRDYDLILCDLLMPEMTGMEFFARLSRDYPEHVERVVFMTGGAFSTTAREFLSSVKNPKLHKPFDAETLRQIVRSRTTG